MHKYLVLALLGVLVALGVYASPRGVAPYDPNLLVAERNARLRGGGGFSPTPVTAASYLPESGVGAPAIANQAFCEVADSLGILDNAGDWWCAQSSGSLTYTGSSLTFTSSGGGLVTRPECPNGPDCSDVDYYLLLSSTSSSVYSTTPTTLPAGDFTACASYRRFGALSNLTPLTLYGDYAAYPAGVAFAMGCQGGCGGTLQDTVGNLIATGDSTPPRATPFVQCLRYNDTTKEMCASNQGAAFTNCQTVVGFTSPNQLSTIVTINTDNAGNVYGNMQWRGSFVVAKAMTDTEVQNLTATLQPKTIRSNLNASILSYTRASYATCCKYELPDGADRCNSLLFDYPCINNSTFLQLESTGITNQLLYSWKLDNAPWSNTATVTLDFFEGPFQFPDEVFKVEDFSGGASESISQTVSGGAVGTFPMAASCWLYADTLGTARIRITGTGDATGDVECVVNPINPSQFQRYGCRSPAAYGAGVTAVTMEVLPGTVDADTGAIYVSNCQLEGQGATPLASFAPTSYVMTEDTVGSRASATASFTKPALITDTAGCASIRMYQPRYSTEVLGSGRVWGDSGGVSAMAGMNVSGGNFNTYVTDSAGNTVSSPVVAGDGLGAAFYSATSWESATSTLTSWNDIGMITSAATYGGTMFTGSTQSFPGTSNILNSFIGSIYMDSVPTACPGLRP